MSDTDIDLKQKILNFIYIDDDGFISHDEMEKKMIKWIVNNNEITMDMYELFYKNHLDLFIKNEGGFQAVLNKVEFNMSEYLRYRKVYTTIAEYFKNLNIKFIELYDPNKYKDADDIKSPLLEKRKSDTYSEKKQYPDKSIFLEIKPEEFARTCHKLFVYSFCISEMRYFQYKAKHESLNIKGYNSMFGGIFNNYYRRMEREIELYCDNDILDELLDIFKKIIRQFIILQNVALAKITIKLLQKMDVCNKGEIDEFIDDIEKIKGFSKYTYLKSADVIYGAFISASVTDKKFNSFKIIQEKLLKTKDEIMSKDVISNDIKESDIIVYNYLQPTFLFKDPLYKLYKDTMDISCIKKKCKNEK